MDASARKVSEIMATKLELLQQDQGLDVADDLMQKGHLRHLPVVDGRRLVGLISHRDLLAASLSKALEFEDPHRRTFLRSVDVQEVMIAEVVSIGPEATLADAARMMLERQIGCLPVTDTAGEMLGLVTESDLLRAAYGEEASA